MSRKPGGIERTASVGILLSCLLALSVQPAARGGIRREPLHWTKFTSDESGEFLVKIHAKAEGTSWERPGRECAALSISIDGHYDQHLFLLHGSLEAEYRVLIGPLGAGEHTLEISWDRAWARDLDDVPEVSGVDLGGVNRPDPNLEPFLRSPILYLRKDALGAFRAVPLVLYWETEGSSRISYTVVFSGKEGGAGDERLMARWGRTTDIRWCYSFSRNSHGVEEFFAARDDHSLPFHGEHEGSHPILYGVSATNDFSDRTSDAAPVRLRMAPVEATIRNTSREAVMDQHPWTYMTMARELEREGKIESPGDPRTARISDPRNYAYIEACAQQRGTEIYFDILLRGQSRWYSSDHSDASSRIERSGCFRSAIELPPGTRADDLQLLRINCLPAALPEDGKPVSSPRAEILSVNKVFFLTPEYRPGGNLLERTLKTRINPGRSLAIEFQHP